MQLFATAVSPEYLAFWALRLASATPRLCRVKFGAETAKNAKETTPVGKGRAKTKVTVLAASCSTPVTDALQHHVNASHGSRPHTVFTAREKERRAGARTRRVASR